MSTADLIKAEYPDIKWDEFEDADRALNWELWHGTLPDNYWTYVEPLEHYVWRGFEIAVGDIEEMLSPLPHELWFDSDCDYVTETNPEEDDFNWGRQCKFCFDFLYWNGDGYSDSTDGDCCSGDDEGNNENQIHEPGDAFEWVGSNSWQLIDVRKVLMYEESWKQVF